MKDGSSSWFISSFVIINYGFLNGISQTKRGEPVGEFQFVIQFFG